MEWTQKNNHAIFEIAYAASYSTKLYTHKKLQLLMAMQYVMFKLKPPVNCNFVQALVLF